MTSRNERVWRKAKIFELLTYGMSQRQIASGLQCSVGTVNVVVKSLKREAFEEHKKYIVNDLAFELKKIRAGIEENQRFAKQIMLDSKKDDRTRMMAVSLSNETYKIAAELSDATASIDISAASKEITSIKNDLDKLELKEEEKKENGIDV